MENNNNERSCVVFLGYNDTRITDNTDTYEGKCRIKRKYKEINPYKDLNGNDQNQGYYLTFDITVKFTSKDEEKTFRRLINAPSVNFYPNYFAPYSDQGLTFSPIKYSGKLKMKKEELEIGIDTLQVTLTVEVEDIEDNYRDVSSSSA